MTLARSSALVGRRLLLVEDDYFIAEDFAAAFAAAGADVIGPVATLADALDLLARTERLDGAILDIDLGGEKVYPLVDALKAQGVPVLFATGYDRGSIPTRYADVPLCEKPVEPERCTAAMFG